MIIPVEPGRWLVVKFVTFYNQNMVSFDDLDGGLDDQKSYKSLLHGVLPTVEHHSSFQAEIEYILEYLKQVESDGENLHEVCLVARTHELLKQ